MQIHALFLNSIYYITSSAQETVVISPLLFTEMPFYDMAWSKRQRNFLVYTRNGYFMLPLKDFYHQDVLITSILYYVDKWARNVDKY